MVAVHCDYLVQKVDLFAETIICSLSVTSSKDCDYALGLCIPGASATTINVPIIKVFAKRNISHQFKSLINSLTIDTLFNSNLGYLGLPIFSPIVALGFERAKFLLDGAAPSGPPELRPCRNRLKTLSAAVNAAQCATRIFLER